MGCATWEVCSSGRASLQGKPENQVCSSQARGSVTGLRWGVSAEERKDQSRKFRDLCSAACCEILTPGGGEQEAPQIWGFLALSAPDYKAR